MQWRWLLLGATAAVLATRPGRRLTRRYVEPAISFRPEDSRAVTYHTPHECDNRIGVGSAWKEVRVTKIWGLSKRDADYGPAPTAAVRCDRCKFMFPPLALGGCRLVRGVITGASSCKEFAPRHAEGTETRT